MRVANGALEGFRVKNCSKIVFFPLGAEILVLELPICAAFARNSIVLCNLVSSDRGGMSASMFLAAAAACKTFAAESRKSCWSWSCCITRLRMVLWQQICLHSGADHFPLILFTKWYKIVVFSTLASRSGFGAAVSGAATRNSILLCNSMSADRSGKASRCCGCARNTFVFRS